MYVKLPFPLLPYLGLNTNDCDEEDFFRTGDIGRFDEESYLAIEGRLKDFIRMRDVDNQLLEIHAATIEEVILKETDFATVCVVGVYDPGASFEVPAAAILKNPNSKMMEQDVVKIVAEKLTPKYIEGGVYFLDKIPTNTVGKVRKLDVIKIINKLRNGG